MVFKDTVKNGNRQKFPLVNDVEPLPLIHLTSAKRSIAIANHGKFITNKKIVFYFSFRSVDLKGPTKPLASDIYA